MALTRAMLKAMGLTEEQVESVIEAHTEVTTGLKKSISDLTEKAAAFDGEHAALEKLKADGGDWSAKLTNLQKEFDDYKANIEAEKQAAQKDELLDGMLTDAGIGRDSVRKLIRKSYDMSSFDVEDGAVKDRDTVIGNIKTNYAEFVGNTQNTGVPTHNPPSHGSNKPMTMDDVRGMSIEEINKNWDTIRKIKS